jgi:hypothetical protein
LAVIFMVCYRDPMRRFFYLGTVWLLVAGTVGSLAACGALWANDPEGPGLVRAGLFLGWAVFVIPFGIFATAVRPR